MNWKMAILGVLMTGMMLGSLALIWDVVKNNSQRGWMQVVKLVFALAIFGGNIMLSSLLQTAR